MPTSWKRSDVHNSLAYTVSNFLSSAINRFEMQLPRQRISFGKILEKVAAETNPFFFIQIGAHNGVSGDPLRPFVMTHECEGIRSSP